MFNFEIKSEQTNKSIKSDAARLIGTAGEVSTSFDTNGQEVYRSCGVTFQDKHYIFGGETKKDQILQINDCDLISIGNTPFNHNFGACGSSNEVIILCFEAYDAKLCRQAPSPSGPWTEMAKSAYIHSGISIATSPGNK